MAQSQKLAICFTVIVTRFDKENGYFQLYLFQRSSSLSVEPIQSMDFLRRRTNHCRTLFQTNGKQTGKMALKFTICNPEHCLC
ncbi:hypothetical protein ACEQPO_14635 [Bacillus sp. SL00103]